MSRKTRKAPAAAAAAAPVADYEEGQVAHLCALHSLNHILQEQKCIWKTNAPLLISKATGKAAAAGAGPKDAGVQINCWALCKNFGTRIINNQRDEFMEDEIRRIRRRLHEMEPKRNNAYYSQPQYAEDFDRDLVAWKKIQATYGTKTDAEIKAALLKEYKKKSKGFLMATTLADLSDGGIGCDMAGQWRGQLPWDTIKELLTMLGLQYEEAAQVDWKQKVDIDSPDLLGLLINQGAWHYVSVPKYTTRIECGRRRYVFAESRGYGLDDKILTCHDKRSLYKLITMLPPQRMFILTVTPETYRSVAVQRMDRRFKSRPYTRRAAAAARNAAAAAAAAK
jgi:hypothetical protein